MRIDQHGQVEMNRLYKNILVIKDWFALESLQKGWQSWHLIYNERLCTFSDSKIQKKF